MAVPDGACATDHWQSLSLQPTACWEKKKKKKLKEVDDAEKDRVDDVPEETNSAGLSQSRRDRLHG